MESSSAQAAEAAPAGDTATVPPVLMSLTMLTTAEDGDVCGPDGVCI